MWLLLLLLFSASFVACISTDDQDVHHFKQQQPQQSSEFSGWRTYAGGIFEAVRAGKMSMLFVLDGTLWSQRLVRDFEGKAKKNEIPERLLQSFVFIKAHEQELPPELLIEINQVRAPCVPCIIASLRDQTLLTSFSLAPCCCSHT